MCKGPAVARPGTESMKNPSYLDFHASRVSSGHFITNSLISEFEHYIEFIDGLHSKSLMKN